MGNDGWSRCAVLKANPAIHRVAKALLAAEVPLGRLNGHMTEKELDLFQLAAC
jgi:hypothetical protein